MDLIPHTRYERVFVETPLDTDSDGRRDRIAVYLLLPETASPAQPVPAVFIANPYMLDCNEELYVLHDVNVELPVLPARQAAAADVLCSPAPRPVPPPGLPQGTAETSPVDPALFEPVLRNNNPFYQQLPVRGYAVAFCGGLGTKGSQGLISTGSADEITAFRTVVDWLCGRAPAYRALGDSCAVSAAWCSGKICMTGKSYVGTLCWGVAATGVDGLVTVIAEASISSWYDYYRQNGLCSPALDWQGDDIDLLSDYCLSRRLDAEDWPGIRDLYAEKSAAMRRDEDRRTGLYNAFWAERDYRLRAGNIRASALIVHGINDWNVKMTQCIPMWQALRARGIPCRLLLHQGQHIRLNTLQELDFNAIFFAWLDHWLLGRANGILDRLQGAMVESNLAPQSWSFSREWPPQEAAEHLWHVCGGELREGASGGCGSLDYVDDLAAAGYVRAEDNQAAWLEALCAAPNSWSARALAPPVGRTLRLCGTPEIRFTAAIGAKAAILSCALVDYGEACRLRRDPTGGEDEPKHFDFEPKPSSFRLITRVSCSAQVCEDLMSTREISPAQPVSFRLRFVPTDWQLQAGHRLGLLFYGADAQLTPRPAAKVPVHIDAASVTLKLRTL